MNTFSLLSIDWETVSLLYGDHFRAETEYLEERTRWLLCQGQPWGVIRLAEDGLTVRGNPDRDHEVSLRGLTALTRQGRIIHIADDGGSGSDRLTGTIRWGEMREDVLTVYVGVGPRKEPTSIKPDRQDVGLLECGFLGVPYRLAVASGMPSPSDWDWLAIGQVRREVSVYQMNPAYLPECASLNSHPVLWDSVRAIARQAETCLQTLQQRHLLTTRFHPVVVAQAVVPLAVLVDRSLQPRAYLDKAGMAIRSCLLVLTNLPTAERAHPRNQEFQQAAATALSELDRVAANEQGPPNWFPVLHAVYNAIKALVAFCAEWRGDAPITPERPLEPQPIPPPQYTPGRPQERPRGDRRDPFTIL